MGCCKSKAVDAQKPDIIPAPEGGFRPGSSMPPEALGPNYHSGKSGSASPTEDAGRQPGSPHSVGGLTATGAAAAAGSHSAANTGRAADAVAGKDGSAGGPHDAPIGAHLVDAQLVGGNAAPGAPPAADGGAEGGAFGSTASASGSGVDVDVVTGVLEKRGAWSTPGYKRWTARFIVISNGELTYYKTQREYEEHAAPRKGERVTLPLYAALPGEPPERTRWRASGGDGGKIDENPDPEALGRCFYLAPLPLPPAWGVPERGWEYRAVVQADFEDWMAEFVACGCASQDRYAALMAEAAAAGPAASGIAPEAALVRILGPRHPALVANLPAVLVAAYEAQLAAGQPIDTAAARAAAGEPMPATEAQSQVLQGGSASDGYRSGAAAAAPAAAAVAAAAVAEASQGSGEPAAAGRATAVAAQIASAGAGATAAAAATTTAASESARAPATSGSGAGSGLPPGAFSDPDAVRAANVFTPAPEAAAALAGKPYDGAPMELTKALKGESQVQALALAGKPYDGAPMELTKALKDDVTDPETDAEWPHTHGALMGKRGKGRYDYQSRWVVLKRGFMTYFDRQQDRKRGAKPNADNFVPVSAYRVVVPLAPQLLRLEPVDKDFDRGRVWELKVMSEHASDREHWVQLLLLHGAHRSGEGASAPASKTGAAGAMRSSGAASGASSAAGGGSSGAAAGGGAGGAAAGGGGGGGMVHGGLAPNGYEFSKHPDVWEACEAPAPPPSTERLIYFFHKPTGASQWQLPDSDDLCDEEAEALRARNAAAAGSARSSRR